MSARFFGVFKITLNDDQVIVLQHVLNDWRINEHPDFCRLNRHEYFTAFYELVERGIIQEKRGDTGIPVYRLNPLWIEATS